MMKNHKVLSLCLSMTMLAWPVVASGKKRDAAKAETTAAAQPGVLWRDPVDIGARNLLYGPGGKEHEPHGPTTFIKEDLDGTNPKIVVRDEDGVKWKVKMGAEARPETAATRLVWAAGYFVNEDYFVPKLQVANLPARLHRGQKYVGSDGSIANVRMKRYLKGEEKAGNWEWRADPFIGTREYNGLRVMMALLNNWDLTDENNKVYEERRGERIYMVSDLGSTFGTPGLTWPMSKARGNVHSYSHSKFITRVTADSVDVGAPRRDSLFFLATPREFFQKLKLRAIGKNIPRDDARWIGGVLGRLSPEQIRDAFRAAGYSPKEVEGFAHVVELRIAELQKL
ncbi:MAG TPA: hypothetical protein VEU96_17495 [Bryobacteraceae bacterium]|nr:hypothetical protein [Bryobacteraceae bacterium]